MNSLVELYNRIRFLPWRLKHNYYYPVKTWFKNIWGFRAELANTHPWDYSGLLLLMRRQIITMEGCQRVHGNHLNAHKVAKDLRVVIKLLDRLIEEDYSVMTDGEYGWVDCEPKGCSMMVVLKQREPKYIFPKGTHKQLYKHEENRRKADLDMLLSYFKHYKSWWD